MKQAPIPLSLWSLKRHEIFCRIICITSSVFWFHLFIWSSLTNYIIKIMIIRKNIIVYESKIVLLKYKHQQQYIQHHKQYFGGGNWSVFLLLRFGILKQQIHPLSPRLGAFMHNASFLIPFLRSYHVVYQRYQHRYLEFIDKMQIKYALPYRGNICFQAISYPFDITNEMIFSFDNLIATRWMSQELHTWIYCNSNIIYCRINQNTHRSWDTDNWCLLRLWCWGRLKPNFTKVYGKV